MGTKSKSVDWRKLDSHYEREQRKYGSNPLPSREFLLQWLGEQGKLLTVGEMIEAFALNAEQAQYFIHRLKAMVSSGQLLINRQNRIGVASKMDLRSGYVIAHPEGYGFLNLDGEEADGFIPPKYMQGLMHGDKILARVSQVDARGRKDYAPVEILERAQKRVVGKLQNKQGIWFVTPENKRLTQPIIIAQIDCNVVKVGQIVIAEILEYPVRHNLPIGQVVEVLGDEMAAGLEVAIAIENYNIAHKFPSRVRKQVAQFAETLQPKDYTGRLDLRHLPMVTIDGISARDFDDAVYAEKRGDNYRLYVAIADVAHYVRPDDALDHEAYLRGTSVYFPDRVIPMLPEELSNGLCSLNPNVDRLALVCELTLNQEGITQRAKFHRAVIHSHARLTYETVEKILFEQDAAMRESFSHLLEPLTRLKEVYELLHRARVARHTIDFEFPEAEFAYDAEGKIESISAKERLQSHKLIEECMIVANVAAAQFLQKNKIPALYRVHDEPSAERLEALIAYVARLGLAWNGSAEAKITPKDFAQLTQKIAGREDKGLIDKMILRSMAQAVYSPENRGHFGLALSSYAHFTSPIRRYPDLLVHRAIHYLLEGGKAKDYYYSPEVMAEMGQHCSMTERRADEATRDAMDFLKAEFMSHRVGEVFHGRISNILNFGFFVTLEDYFIDGLVHVSNLTSDYYHFDAESATLTGERSGRRFTMMDEVVVAVAQVNIEERKIDFQLIEHNGLAPRKSRAKKSPQTKETLTPKKRTSKTDKKPSKGRQTRKTSASKTKATQTTRGKSAKKRAEQAPKVKKTRQRNSKADKA